MTKVIITLSCLVFFVYAFCQKIYRKIPKIRPGAYIFQRPLYSEGLSYGAKFAFQNRVG